MKEGEWSLGMRQLNIDAVQKIFAWKDAEIERLKAVVEAQVERLSYLEARHANEFNLLARAADALEYYLVDDFSSKDNPDWRLVDELRKAAE